MTMPSQHDILTGLRPTDEIGQTRFGFCDRELHVVLLSRQYGPFGGPFQAVPMARKEENATLSHNATLNSA
jgi:hypothetical protein